MREKILKLNQVAEQEKINGCSYQISYNIAKENYEIIRFNYRKQCNLERVKENLTAEQAIEYMEFFFDMLEIER